VIGRGIQWKPQSIKSLGTTTITVQGNVSGITKVVSITPIPNPDSNVNPIDYNANVTDSKF
jgi:hypothetical protein